MKKIFHKIHLWLSVPFGLIISIICLSGAALVFEDEITELLYPERYFVEQVKEKPLPTEELLKIVSATLPDSISVSSVNIPSNPKRAYQVGLSKPRRASVYVDQYTGEVKPRFERLAFFSVMFRTHRWLLDSMKPNEEIFWGKMIVGTSTLIFVFVLITGIIIWVPRTLKGLKPRLKISLTRGLKRFWYDLHVVGGIYTAIILLVLALTGLTWSFSWYRTGFYKVFGVEVQQGGGHGGAQQALPSNENDSQTATIDEPQDSLRHEGRHNRGGKPDMMATNNKENAVEIPDSLKREKRREGRGDRERSEGKRRGGRRDSLRQENSEERNHRKERFAENENITEKKPDSLRQESRGGRGNRRSEGRNGDNQSSTVNFSKWQLVYEQLAEKNPDYKRINISRNSANVSHNTWGNQRGSDRYNFNPETGDITDTQLYKDQDKAGKIRGWIYSFHVGSWGGMLTRILTFIAAFVGGALPLTGYYFWIKKSIKKRSKKKK